MACDAKSRVSIHFATSGKSFKSWLLHQLTNAKKKKRKQRVLGKFYRAMIKNVSGVSVNINDPHSNEDELSDKNDHDSNIAGVVS